MNSELDVDALIKQARAIVNTSSVRERGLMIAGEFDGGTVLCFECGTEFQPVIIIGDGRQKGCFRVAKNARSMLFSAMPICPNCRRKIEAYCYRTGDLVVFYTYAYASKLADFMNRRIANPRTSFEPFEK